MPVTILSSCYISYFGKVNFTNIKAEQYHLLSKIAFYLDSKLLEYYTNITTWIITIANSLSAESNEIQWENWLRGPGDFLFLWKKTHYTDNIPNVGSITQLKNKRILYHTVI